MYCTAYKSIRERPEAEFITYNFVEVLDIILRVLRLEVSI
jgi:hypothetical protein